LVDHGAPTAVGVTALGGLRL
jgi:hypothetical protein